MLITISNHFPWMKVALVPYSAFSDEAKKLLQNDTNHVDSNQPRKKRDKK